MFGDSLLICPVTKPMYYGRGGCALEREKTWECYLPAGTGWYDFYSGELYEGGREVTKEAPLERIPVFVRAGSILPMERGMMYADEQVETPFEIHIYPGKDAEFLLYEDDGDGYAYEEGMYQCIRLEWKEDEGMLRIGAAEKAFAQSLNGRTCLVALEGTGRTEIFVYDGKERCVRF